MLKVLSFLCCTILVFGKVDLGIDRFFFEGREKFLEGKNVALLINHTSRDSKLQSTESLFLQYGSQYHVVALFSPEHGLEGVQHADESVADSKTHRGITCFSLFGKQRRPTSKMLEGVDVIICDLQDIGVRSYTYATTLFYVMEEAAKRGIEVIVLDRPNPLGGLMVDGPMLEENYRSFIGYINVPYCHGLTIGELASYFNGEYKVGCKLQVVRMKGWERKMTFEQTELPWIPTSPNIPEPDTPLFYASTGILGYFNLVNLGGGIHLPFKVIGAPWIDAELFANKLNAQNLPGVHFVPFHYRPYFGAMKGKECHGVKIIAMDKTSYRPLMVQYMLLGMLKSLYPKKFEEALHNLKKTDKDLFCQVNGNRTMLEIVHKEPYVAWSLIRYQAAERNQYLSTRSKYLLYP